MSVSPPSSPVRSLHAELVAACRALHRAEHRAATLLARCEEERVHLELGYASVRDYAERELGLQAHKAMDLLRLGRALPDFPVLAAALAAGEIAWTKARELLRVLTADNEAAWVEAARTRSSRELEHAVASSLVGEAPPHVGSPKAPARVRVVFTLDTVDAEVLRAALAQVRAATGVSREDVDDGALLASLARRALHDADAASAPTAERYRVVVAHCPDCGRTEGPTAELTDTAVREAACDAELVDLGPGPDHGHRARTVPPAVRRAVLHRDGARCRVPGCTNHLWLDQHHVVPRSVGGPSTAENLVTLCAIHHGLHHAGRLGLWSDDGDLVFAFPGGTTAREPLARPAYPPRTPLARSRNPH